MEIWKPVAGHETLYEVSDLGRFRTLPRTVRAGNAAGYRMLKLRILKGAIGSHGYVAFDVGAGKRTIHSLVLEAFVGPCPIGMQACHNNGIRSDNRLTNLRWDTPQSNTDDKYRHGTQRFGDSHWNTKVRDGEVERIREAALFGARGGDLAAAYGVSPSTISMITNNLRRRSIHAD